MLKEKSESLMAAIPALFFIILVVYLLTQDISLVGPM
jgi:hypothetical protein